MLISDQQTTCRDDPETLLSLLTGYLPALLAKNRTQARPLVKRARRFRSMVAPQVKTPVVNTDDLSSVPGIHMVEGENLL